MEGKRSYADVIQDRIYPGKEFNATLRFLIVLFALILCEMIVFTQIFNGVVVVGDSMNDTLHDGDYLYMQINYSSVERGDIIVIDTHTKTESGAQKLLIKRLIGLPGDSLYAEEGRLFRKEAGQEEFVLMNEEYLPEDWVHNYTIASKESPVVLGEGEIFFMGDNRNDSEDSRGRYRTLKLNDIVGVVTPWSVSCKGFFTTLFNLF